MKCSVSGYHGKRIDPATAFIVFDNPAAEQPDRNLLAWQYKQCAMALIRG